MANLMLPGGLEIKEGTPLGGAPSSASYPATGSSGYSSSYDTWDPNSGTSVDDFLYNELITQQQGGLSELWKGGLDKDTAARGMASDLSKSGITNLNQVGWSEKAPKYGWTDQARDQAGIGEDNSGALAFGGYDENDPTYGKYAPGAINKNTGEALYSGFGERTGGHTFSGSYEGKGGTGYNVDFDSNGNPVFYTHGEKTDSYKDVAPFLTFASFAFPALAPYIAAGNAAYQYNEGNKKGAIISALGAAAGIGGQVAGLAESGAAAAANNPSAYTAPSVGGISASTIGDVAKGLGYAGKAAGVANSIANEDYLGAVLGATKSFLPNLFGNQQPLGSTQSTESRTDMMNNNQEFDWTKLLQAGGSLANNWSQMNNQQSAASSLQPAQTALSNQMTSLSSMYGQDSPYAQALRQRLDRKDAAAGRRSQYGPREVELQAHLAGLQPQVANSMSNLAGAQGTLAQQSSGFKTNSGANVSRLINTGAGFLRDMYKNPGTGRRQYTPEELAAMEARMGSNPSYNDQEFSAPLYQNFQFPEYSKDDYGFDTGGLNDMSTYEPSYWE